MKKISKRLKKQVLELFIGCALVACLVSTGIYFIDSEILGFSLGSGSGEGGYRNITLTDAQLACQEKAHNRFGERLRIITIDTHSSRYDKEINRFKMFFSLDLYPKKRNKTNPNDTINYFVNCFVHGSRGTVTHFESVENKEEKDSPLGESDGNFFGF